jgi:hypothetical protein
VVKNSGKSCVEDPRYVETRKTILSFNKRFNLYVVFSVLYGLVFLNYIDIITPGGAFGGYHLWLTIMYFFPFVALTISFPRNWQLAVGLGLVASLMNDVFYGLARNFVGPFDLATYYNHWLIPGGAALFQLNLGFSVITVFSWMMALSIYARIVIVYFLLKAWRGQAKIRCLQEGPKKNKGFLASLRKTNPLASKV